MSDWDNKCLHVLEQPLSTFTDRVGKCTCAYTAQVLRRRLWGSPFSNRTTPDPMAHPANDAEWIRHWSAIIAQNGPFFIGTNTLDVRVTEQGRDGSGYIGFHFSSIRLLNDHVIHGRFHASLVNQGAALRCGQVATRRILDRTILILDTFPWQCAGNVGEIFIGDRLHRAKLTLLVNCQLYQQLYSLRSTLHASGVIGRGHPDRDRRQGFGLSVDGMPPQPEPQPQPPMAPQPEQQQQQAEPEWIVIAGQAYEVVD